jgi:hypothetical protein
MVTQVSDTVLETPVAEGQLKYLQHLTSGLTITLSRGVLQEDVVDGGQQVYPQASYVLTDNANNWVYFEFDNTPATLEVSTTKPDENIMLIHLFVTSGGAVTSHTDYRWKTINNRFLQEPFWPATEDELILFKHKSGAGKSGFIIIRGLDTPRQRSVVLAEEKAADLRIASDDSTSGNNAYGFWRRMTTNGVRMLQTRNVNSSTAIPFVAFKSDAAGINPDLDWVALATPPQMINDSSTPITAQTFSLDVNPVYPEIILSSSANWWVYDDNEDDTFTVNRPIDSFDTKPNGSGSRTHPTTGFSDDGEFYVSASVGSNTLDFYDRSPTGARYQLNNAVSVNTRWNGALVLWDPVHSEFIFKTRTTDPSFLLGYANSGGTWSQAWAEDATSNSAWDATLPASINTEGMWLSNSGDYLVLTTRTSSGSKGIHGFTRRVSGGWAWDSSFDLLDENGTSIITADLDYNVFSYVKGEYVYVSHGEALTEGIDHIYKYNGSGSFSHVFTLDKGQTSTDDRTPFGATSASNNIITTKDGTVSDAADPIINAYQPFWWWTPYCTVGQDTFDYRKNVYGWSIAPGTAEYSRYAIRNNDSPINTPNSVAGPIANTYAMEAVTGLGDMELISGSFDAEDYLADTLQNIAENGRIGSLMVIWKTPTSWPVATDANTVVRPLAGFGHAESVAGANTQPNMILGVNVNSAGAGATVNVGIGANNGSREYLLLQGPALSTNTWYCTVLHQDVQNHNGLALYQNGVIQTLTETSPTVYNFPGGYYYWLAEAMAVTKTGQFLNSGNGSVGQEVPGAAIHLIGLWTRHLAVHEQEGIVAAYGL